MRKKMILSEDRPATTIPVKMPADVLNDLERVAQAKGSVCHPSHQTMAYHL